MKVAILVKQVPLVEEFRLDETGRLRREGLDLEINAYCRRAVSKGVEIAREHGATSTVITLGPPSAADALAEAIAWGADRGVLVTDPAFAGSDTLATSRALVAALRRLGEVDLILVGRNSVDADTGQVGPQIAAMLGWPFLASARELTISPGGEAHARLELDDGYAAVEVQLPAVVSCAERLCQPAKVAADVRATVPASRITTFRAADLGPGPWGQQGSPTRVGDVRLTESQRRRQMLEGPLEQQVKDAITLLDDMGALHGATAMEEHRRVVGPLALGREPITVIIEPGRSREARELLGAAADLAVQVTRHVVALNAGAERPAALSSWGADEVVNLRDVTLPDDVAASIARWCRTVGPWAVLAPSTTWGREVASRLAVLLEAGLTGDALDFAVADDRLVCWKPAFGDRLLAAITSSSPVQLATVRPGVLPVLQPRVSVPTRTTELPGTATSRVRIMSSDRDDRLDKLSTSRVIIGVGMGVPREDYQCLEELRTALGAELGASRKVTDAGWLPHSRQIGLTGRNVAPALYVALGIRGKLNHVIGINRARCVLAVNNDRGAPIFGHADLGIVGDWKEFAGEFPRALAEHLGMRQAQTRDVV